MGEGNAAAAPGVWRGVEVGGGGDLFNYEAVVLQKRVHRNAQNRCFGLTIPQMISLCHSAN